MCTQCIAFDLLCVQVKRIKNFQRPRQILELALLSQAAEYLRDCSNYSQLRISKFNLKDIYKFARKCFHDFQFCILTHSKWNNFIEKRFCFMLIVSPRNSLYCPTKKVTIMQFLHIFVFFLDYNSKYLKRSLTDAESILLNWLTMNISPICNMFISLYS